MASDHIKLEIEPDQVQNLDPSSGVTIGVTIELNGNWLRVDGHHDNGVGWHVEIILTDTQLKALRGLPMANEPVQPTRPPQHR